jgi:Plasmid encoded RepA protein
MTNDTVTQAPTPTKKNHPSSHNILELRPIDRKRLDATQARVERPVTHRDTWYIHTVLTQCFLPYRDPKTDRWQRKNGDFSILLVAGDVEHDASDSGFRNAGLPYGAKPRLFQSYVSTLAIKQQSPVIQVERSMTAMMQALGLKVSGGKEGSIRAFKDQITRFAACHFTIVGPGSHGGRKYLEAAPIKSFEVWFPKNSRQDSLWPSEIVLSPEYFYSLKDHAVPFDFRALKAIQNKPRAHDIYLWMTQRLCRISTTKPLLLRWPELYEMFGGQSSPREFKRNFPQDLLAARLSYPDARMEEHKEGFLFKASAPPVPRTKFPVR